MAPASMIVFITTVTLPLTRQDGEVWEKRTIISLRTSLSLPLTPVEEQSFHGSHFCSIWPTPAFSRACVGCWMLPLCSLIFLDSSLHTVLLGHAARSYWVLSHLINLLRWQDQVRLQALHARSTFPPSFLSLGAAAIA